MAPHVWFVLLAGAAVASASGVLAARRGLTVAAALLATSIATAGVTLLAGAEIVAVALVILEGMLGLGLVGVARAAPPVSEDVQLHGRLGNRGRRAFLAGSAGAVVASITGVAAMVATGTDRVVTAVPATAAVLADPLYTGGALLVDGTALVLLVVLVSARSSSEAR